MQDILPYWNGLPHLKKIVVWGDKELDELYTKDVLRWEDLMKLGQEMNHFPVLERQKNMVINQCCVLIYTSGTTGYPKGNQIFISISIVELPFSFLMNMNILMNSFLL